MMGTSISQEVRASLTIDALSDTDRQDFAALEAVVEAGRETFVQVGSALLLIRDRRLYRETHRRFEDYVRDRWQYSRQRAYQLITAANVARNLVSTTVDIGGLTERQARTLTLLPAEAQGIVYRLAKMTAPRGQVTARHLNSLAAVATEVIGLGAIDDGSGKHVAWDEISPDRKAALFEAAVTEDTYERAQRQREHIRRALNSCSSVEWFTPATYVQAAHAVLGGIDIDPASCAQANQTVGASRFFTVEEDGLTRDWPGRVWLNPPYGGQQRQFVGHLLDQYGQGITKAAIVVLSAGVPGGNPDWFSPLWQFPICFAGRVSFDSPDGPTSAPTNGTVFIYLGSDPANFVSTFGAFGPVVRRWIPEATA